MAREGYQSKRITAQCPSVLQDKISGGRAKQWQWARSSLSLEGRENQGRVEVDDKMGCPRVVVVVVVMPLAKKSIDSSASKVGRYNQ